MSSPQAEAAASVPKLRKWFWTGAVFAAGLLTTLAAWHWERENEELVVRRELEYRAGNLATDLRDALRHCEQVLAAAQGLYAAQPDVTRERWHTFVTKLDIARKVPAVLAVALQPRVAAPELPRFVERMAREAGRPFAVQPPPESRAEYFPIAYIEPATWRNEQLIGLDNFADVTRRRTMEAARDSGDIELTPPLMLMDEATTGGAPGFLMFAPVYRNGAEPGTLAERRRLHAGYVVASFRLDEMMRGILSREFDGIDVHVSTGGAPGDVLFDTDSRAQVDDAPKTTDSIAFGGQLFDIAFRVTPEFAPAKDRHRSNLALAVGAAATLLGTLLIWIQVNARSWIERRAQQIAASLDASERRYALAMETTTDGIWERDLSGGRTEVSPRFEALLGRAAGSFARDGVAPDDLVHPADRFRLQEALAAHVDEGRPLVVELRMRHADGHYVWVRMQGRAQRDGAGRAVRLLGSIADVSEVHGMLDRFRDLSQMASDWFWEQDANYRFTSFSESIGQRNSTIVAAALGKTRWELAGEPEAPEMAAHRAAVEAHQSFRDFEYFVRDKKGALHWYSVNGKPVYDDKGIFAGYRGTSRDVTARKRLEEELRNHRDNLSALVEAQTADLVRAKEAAEQAVRSKAEFLANMSHELRTPMHAILSFARLGHDKAEAVPPEKLREYFARVQVSAERLLDLVNDLLDLAKLEAGKMAVEMRDLDLAQLAHEVVHDLEAMFEARHLRLALPPPSCNPFVFGDAMRLAQVIRNLLSNALKFSAGGGLVTVEFADAELPAGRRAGDTGMQPALRLTIADEGVGIPEGELEAIFDKFYQSSKTRTGAGGTGLGLSICREIVAMHRGTIRARNRVEGGAAFDVILPKGAA